MIQTAKDSALLSALIMNGKQRHKELNLYSFGSIFSATYIILLQLRQMLGFTIAVLLSVHLAAPRHLRNLSILLVRFCLCSLVDNLLVFDCIVTHH